MSRVESIAILSVLTSNAGATALSSEGLVSALVLSSTTVPIGTRRGRRLQRLRASAIGFREFPAPRRRPKPRSATVADPAKYA